MRRLMIATVLSLGCAFVAAPLGAQRGPSAKWDTAGGDAQLTGWQKIEPRITSANVPAMKLLWKLKLGDGVGGGLAPTEPLFTGRMITEAGFRDAAYVLLPGNNLYAVDYELGRLMWSKHFDVQNSPAQACPNGQFAAFIIQPLPTFTAGRRGAPGRGSAAAGRSAAPAPRPEPPPEPAARVAFASPGGGFRMRGIFVLTSDGYLHELRTANGADYGEPVKFLPYQDSNLSDPTVAGDTMYVATRGECGGQMQPNGVWKPEPNGVWSVDAKTADYPVNSHATGVNATGLDGPAQSTDGKTLYQTTGSGNQGTHPDGVLALDAATLEVKDYYTPASDPAGGPAIDVSPAVFQLSGKDVIAAYDADGRLVLLDSASLGGADHHTPLAQSAPLTTRGQAAWGRLATAELNGTRWIYVAVHGPVVAGLHLAATHGPAPNGSIVAFKVAGSGSALTLTPAWQSANLDDPSPAVIASGHVFTLANGGSGHDARLEAFDDTTGASSYSSGAQIPSPANRSSLALDAGHILFVTGDNTLYSFGIGILH